MRTEHVLLAVSLLQALVWFVLAYAWFSMGREIRRIERESKRKALPKNSG